MNFDVNAGGPISLEQAADWTKRFRDNNPNAVIGHYFGQKVIREILRTKKVRGIRVYKGIDENHNDQLILVGVDRRGNDVLPSLIQFNSEGREEGTVSGDDPDGGIIIDESIPCPPCGTPNQLNGGHDN